MLDLRKYKFNGIVDIPYDKDIQIIIIIANHKYKYIAKKTNMAWKNVYKHRWVLPEKLWMTDHFKRQEQSYPKQEIEMCC